MWVNALHADTNEAADTRRYGNFVRFDEAPEILLLVGPIKEGDFFELRRAMRDQPARLIVTNSPGGNVYESLQVATVIHDNSLATFVPAGASCTSACAFIFFAGSPRAAEGELGVHQFYANVDVGGESVALNDGLRTAQYTTSEIIGFLNEFGTPPFVFEKMFSTENMYFFTDSERNSLSSDFSSPELASLRQRASDLYARTMQESSFSLQEVGGSASERGSDPSPANAKVGFQRFASADIPGSDLLTDGVRGISIEDCEYLCADSDLCLGYSYVPQTTWCWPKGRTTPLVPKQNVISGIKQQESALNSMEEKAIGLLVSVNSVWSKPNDLALAMLPDFYSDSVTFYGNEMSLSAVMRDKKSFAERWPVRTYQVVPDSVMVLCNASECYVESIVEWAAVSPERGARSTGRSSWNLVLADVFGQLKIKSESGKVLSRD